MRMEELKSENKDWREDFLDYISDNNNNLFGLEYELKKYSHNGKNDHAHCALCWKTIYGIPEEGYETKGCFCKKTGVWLCEQCFRDFSARYHWILISSE